MEELEAKIDSLKDRVQNTKFVENIKAIIEAVQQFDVPTAEKRVLAKVLPLIHTRFTQVFSDNVTFFATMDDDLMSTVIRENVEAIFQLAEIVQDLMNYIYDHSPVHLSSIESVLKYLPKCIQISAEHWKNSPDEYKTAFSEELAKLCEVLKHLYASFLYLLERSIQVQENAKEITLLVEALTVLCEMPKVFSVIDASSIISSWKCFITVICNYSELMENYLDIRVPIQLLTEDICDVLKSLDPHDAQTFQRQLKVLTYLVKVLCKTTYGFEPQLSKFASEMLLFYVKLLCCISDIYSNTGFPKDAIQKIETDILKMLDDLLGNLVVKQTETFKDLIKHFSRVLKAPNIRQQSSFGYLVLLNKILLIIGNSNSDWSDVLIHIIEDVFEFLPNCNSYLFMDGYNGEMYQNLIVHLGVAVLLHDTTFRSSQVLLKHILQENAFVAILALEVYCLIASNITPEDCLSLLVNLLKAIQELHCGFFTNRPEISYLKCLLQRLFANLPDELKKEVVELFQPEGHIQVWRFLGFHSFPTENLDLLEPIVVITADSTQSFNEAITEELIVNVAESIDLLSTVKDFNLINNSKANRIIAFINKFWSCNIDNEILSNNILKYMFLKISRMTASCINSGILKPSLVFPKMQVMLLHQAYTIPILEIVYSVLHFQSLAAPELLREVAVLITVVLRSSKCIREFQLEMLRNLNFSRKEVLNKLLDSLNPSVAQKVFRHIEAPKAKQNLTVQQITKQMFVHKCLEWNIECDDYHPAKKLKIEEKPKNIPLSSLNKRMNPATRGVKTKKPVLSAVNITEHVEDDSSATEVIQRLKGEVKCLVKIGKTEKLTAKNYADIRILMSQLSSLM